MRRWLLAVLAAAMCTGFLTGSPAVCDVQTVLSEWPDWPTVEGAPRRTLRVHIKHNADFGAAVRQAMTNWNNANTGDNRWRFSETTDPNQADVSIEAASLPDTIAGLATAVRHGLLSVLACGGFAALEKQEGRGKAMTSHRAAKE